ncbi:hypothetical protein M407DRAFT_38925, partial [Tulasnella calospora MUT 4182]
GRPFGTIGPPISIYHPIFSRFQTLIQGDGFDPLPEDVVAAFDLMEAAADFYETEAHRLNAITPCLAKLLARKFHGTSGFDGVTFSETAAKDIPLLVMEAKNEVGTGGSDPYLHAAFSYRKLWVEGSRLGMRNACCCPGFVLSMAGPYLTIHGGVSVDNFIVQPLTETLGLANFPAHFDRARYIAKIMAALRICLNEFELFY